MAMLDDLRKYMGEIGSYDPGHQLQLIREWVGRGGKRPGEAELPGHMTGADPSPEEPEPVVEGDDVGDDPFPA